MREINLFRIYQKTPSENLEFNRKARVTAFLLLIVYCLLLGGIFSYWLILKHQNEAIGQKIEIQKQGISKLKQIESLSVFIKQDLSALIPVFASQKFSYREILDDFQKLMPADVSLTQIEFDQKGTLNVTGKATNSFILAKFLENLIDPQQNSFAQDIELSSANRDISGSYVFALKINVKE